MTIYQASGSSTTANPGQTGSASTISFGHLLERKRQREGLSYRDAASASGVTLNTFWRAEQGKNVSGQTLGRLAEWLEVPVAAANNNSFERTVLLSMHDITTIDLAIDLINQGLTVFGYPGPHPLAQGLSEIRQRWAQS